MKFYPKELHVIAPLGATRVGSTNAADDKKGCTCMMTMEFNSLLVFTSFIILDGAYEGLLMKQWKKYAQVYFQKNHSLDKVLEKKHLACIRSLYQGKKSIVWDKAAHISGKIGG